MGASGRGRWVRSASKHPGARGFMALLLTIQPTPYIFIAFTLPENFHGGVAFCGARVLA